MSRSPVVAVVAGAISGRKCVLGPQYRPENVGIDEVSPAVAVAGAISGRECVLGPQYRPENVEIDEVSQVVTFR